MLNPKGVGTAQEAKTTDFFTSFEKGEERLTWENTAETDSKGNKMASGVIGGIPYESILVSPPESSDMKSEIEDGPKSSYTGKANAGWTGGKVLRYAGRHVAEARAYSYNKVFDVSIAVTPESQLSYYLHPQFVDVEQMDYSSTYVSIDLAFTDGTYLSELGAKDQHGIELNPQSQGESDTLYPNQWNYKSSVIGKWLKGKQLIGS